MTRNVNPGRSLFQAQRASISFSGQTLRHRLIKPSGWVVNRAIAGLGTVSFSAYVLHFALLKYIGSFLHLSWPFGKTGLQSIAFEATFVVLTVLAVRVVAGVTYRVIEQPFIAIGKRLLCRRPRALEAHATQNPGPPR